MSKQLEENMKPTIIRIATIIVVITIFNMIVLPDFSLLFASQDEMEEVELVKELYELGRYESALKLLNKFILRYSAEKDKPKKALSFAYYIKAKIFFEAGEKDKMKNALRILFETYPMYILSQTEDIEFKAIAEKIKKDVGHEIMKKNEEKRIPVTLKIVNDIPGNFYVCVDEWESKYAKKFKNMEVQLNVSPGHHTFILFSDDKEMVLTRERKITQESYIELDLDFSKGHDIKKIEPKGSKVIESEGKKSKKKRKFPILLAVGTAVVVGALVFLLTKKKNVEQSQPPVEISIDPDKKIEIQKGSQKEFYVELSNQPQYVVTVTIEIIRGENVIEIESEKSLIFTTSEWNIGQKVTINANENATVGENATIRLRADKEGIEPKYIDVVVVATPMR